MWLDKWRKAGTRVSVCIYNGSFERFLNMCRFKEIELWDIKKESEAIRAETTVKEFYRLRAVCRITGNRIKVIKKKGFMFFFYQYRKHYSFFVGVLIALILTTFWSKFVWDISFQGNMKYTEGVLTDYLKSVGVYTGMPLAELDCSNIEAGIRNEYNEITWVSAKINGTKLEINIKENDVMVTDALSKDEEMLKERDIVASHGGIIDSIVTRKGTPMVKVGDTVEKGQILVSGVVKIFDDAGNHISNVYTSSDADILIKTTKEYHDKLPKEVQEKVYTGNKQKKMLIGLSGKHIKLGFLWEKYEQTDVETCIEPVKLTDSFVLPIYFGSERYYEYNIVTKKYDENSAKVELEKYFFQYLKELSQNKVQLGQYNVKMYTESDGYVLKGSLELIAPLFEYKPVTDIKIIHVEEKKEVQ